MKVARRFIAGSGTTWAWGDRLWLRPGITKPTSGALCEPVSQRLLPLDARWQDLAQIHWPTKNLPELFGHDEATLLAFIREHLFISLFKACAESLASENASRLAAMQRAEKNIDSLLTNLNRTSIACAKVRSTRNSSM